MSDVLKAGGTPLDTLCRSPRHGAGGCCSDRRDHREQERGRVRKATDGDMKVDPLPQCSLHIHITLINRLWGPSDSGERSPAMV
ncbi:hypothetical protein AAFF_G00015470 [Aldrovandia affinis]|uniref:Uncharacterized protein n=1 Tax=Aldrovandia affinis TaxID=143900 RepID=A0AAD7S687_9TELE|nr:hypothetical protein AAFF_G00015470 [Aldrovandia affinis]